MKNIYYSLLNSLAKNKKAERNIQVSAVYSSPLVASFGVWVACVLFGVGVLGCVLIVLACVGTVYAQWIGIEEDSDQPNQ
jgi:hypothetical protein